MLNETLKGLMKTPEKPGDYIENGVLMCGICHTPKQAFLVLPSLTGVEAPRPFPIACQCRREADEKAKAKQRAEEFKVNLGSRWDRCGFHDSGLLRYKFSDDDGGQQQISDTLKRYLSKWEKMYENNIGILLYGPVGTGKSFLASCLCNAVLEKQATVCATSFPRLLNVLQSSPDRQAVLDRLEGFRLAYIDDFGSERATEYAHEQIFNVIDCRYHKKRPVIFTTNLNLKELENPEDMTHSRIYDRVLEMCPIRLCVSGASRRQGLANERRALARELLL